jgi:hypothetical protein
MKHVIKFLSLAVVMAVFTTACQEESENPGQLSESVLLSAESEAVVESAFEDVDDIGYESLFYIEEGGRIAVNEDSPLSCADRTHDKENKTITIDFGEGCEGPHGRVRSGKIIITYTDRMYVPGSVVTMTFESYVCDGKQIEGTRTRTNISESENDYLRFRIQLVNGKVTWEDGTFATREADWEISRIRTPNPINDERIRTGAASGVNRDGLGYTVTITNAIVWRRGCLPIKRVMIPVEGTKVRVLEDGSSCTIDYGEGTCDNLVSITKDGVTTEREIKRIRKNG